MIHRHYRTLVAQKFTRSDQAVNLAGVEHNVGDFRQDVWAQLRLLIWTVRPCQHHSKGVVLMDRELTRGL